MQMSTVLKVVSLAVSPLASRKVRVAMATVVAAYAGQWGLGWDETMVLTVLSVGVALILGIAHEDAGGGGSRVSGLGSLCRLRGHGRPFEGTRQCRPLPEGRGSYFTRLPAIAARQQVPFRRVG